MTQDHPLNHQNPAQLARLLGAYVPVTLLHRVLTAGLPVAGETTSLQAATLFADMSGFTAMSEELASDGPRGAEELNRVLLVTFTAMIDVIHEMGGAVSHFYGDAMSVYFPDVDGQAALRALSCAQQMQQLMLTSFGRVVTNRPHNKDPFFNLTIKIGVGYGRCQILVIGDPARNMEFVLTGTAVDEAAEAEKEANAGDLIASQSILQQIGHRAEAAFSPFGTKLPAVKPRPVLIWSDFSDAALARMIDIISPFVPLALHSRLTQAGSVDVAEHRPVTSMFVQFSFVGDEDDSSAIETAEMGRQLQAYYQWANDVVSRYGAENARVNRVLTGDKGNQLHIMFGAPVAPDAPDQALRCALALLREKPEFIAQQKIGLAVGKVFAGPVGSESRREYTVVGDVVNLSARLMQVCTPDSIWTNVDTANRTRQWIEFETLPEVQLKGKQAAVMPYQAVGERQTTSQLQAYLDRWERPLFGRDQELAQLAADMDTALSGSGRMVALSGPTGVGKSRILGYGTRYWLDHGGIGLLGVCQQHTADVPFTPWRAVWRDFFGLTPGMSLDEQIEALRIQLNVLLPAGEAELALWGDPLGLPIPQTDALQQLTAEARQARFFTMVRRCFQEAAKRQPLLIILEGLHWADQTSLVLLDEVTNHISGSAFFVAVTFRDREKVALASLDRAICHALTVADLSPANARELLQFLVGTAELPQPVEQQLGLKDREGRDSVVNPLFLEEALNVMTAAGVLKVNGRIQVDEQKLAQMQVPDTIHGLLLARLYRLPPATRDLLQVASVIGRQFALDSLTALSEQVPRAMMLDLLNDLTDADMTRLVTADPEWVYLFQHAMTHEVAYESLSYARRQVLHALVADWIQSRYVDNLRPYHPILAFHYSRAGIHEEGLHFSLKAAGDARAIFANKEAVELYNLAESHLQALGMEARWETAVTLFTSRAESLRFLGEFNGAVTDAEQARDLLQHALPAPALTAKTFNLLAELKCRQGQFDDAVTIAQSIISNPNHQIPLDEQARAHQWAGVAASSTGQFQNALDHLDSAEDLCLQAGNNERMARVLETKAFVYFMQKRLEQALLAMQKGVTLSRDVSIPANVASSLSNIALIQSQLGRPQDALTAINEAINVVKDTSRNFLAKALSNKAEILTYLGRYHDAIVCLEEAIDMFLSMDDQLGVVDAYLIMAYEYHAVLQNWEEAAKSYDHAQKIMDVERGKYAEGEVRLLIGKSQMALEGGNRQAAVTQLDQARKLIEENRISWWKPVADYYTGIALVEQGETSAAQKQFQDGLDAIDNEGCPDYHPLLLLQLAKLESDSQKRGALVEASLKAAETRSRFIDRYRCYRDGAKLLAQEDSEDYRNLARFYQGKADAMAAKLLEAAK